MKTFVPLLFVAALWAGCSSLTLKPADFSWPIETELQVDSKGMVHESRYSISFNVKPLLFAELQDSVNVSRHILRMIRDPRGFYFVTAPKFKNVYVFAQTDGGLSAANTIPVSQQGLASPAFNLRSPLVQLLNGKEKPIMLSKEGIVEGGKQQ